MTGGVVVDVDAVEILRTVYDAQEPFELFDILVHEDGKGEGKLSIDMAVFAMKVLIESLRPIAMALIFGYVVRRVGDQRTIGQVGEEREGVFQFIGITFVEILTRDSVTVWLQIAEELLLRIDLLRQKSQRRKFNVRRKSVISFEERQMDEFQNEQDEKKEHAIVSA